MRRRLPLLLVALAVLFLVVAAALQRCGEERLTGRGPTTAKAPEVEFPRAKAQRLRAQKERERRAQAAQAADASPPPPPPAPPDRLTRALASPGQDGALVVEVNAIRHSPLVEKLLACTGAQESDASRGLNELEKELGIDVTEAVDRVAFDKDVLGVSGFFDKLKVPEQLGPGEAVGEGGRLYRTKDDDGNAMVIGRVGDDLLFTGFDEAQVRAAIDRAEGRAPPGPALPDDVMGGEVYGVVGKAFLADLLGDADDPAAARLAEVVTQSRVQMSVDDAAALSLDLATRSPDEGEDLARALGGAVTALRARAAEEGNDELAGLLEQAVVRPQPGGGVAFDVAVPGAEFLRLFRCDADGKPLAADAVPPSSTKR
jgi:hypothetical protein